MDILLPVLTMLAGVSLFLFGMQTMGDGLEKSAGNQLSVLLSKLTSNPIKGFLLGAGVTAIIQSSSATTVMLVGFVNSGIMAFPYAIPVIMGANVGTTVTAWILSLMDIQSGGTSFIEILLTFCKPSTFTPILAVAGVIMYCFLKNPRRKDLGLILLGFSTLIYGMDIMSDAINDSDVIINALTNFMLFFEGIPVLGVFAGAIITAIIQSSSASVGILQTLATNISIPFVVAIPIIMGQNIGTCATAMISSIGANKNAKRVAWVHLSFNIIGTVILLTAYTIVDAIFVLPFPEKVTASSIAIIHTMFNLLCTAMLLPFGKQLGKLATFIVKDKKNEEKNILLDRRLMATPAAALQQCRVVTLNMAETSVASIKKSLDLIKNYDEKIFKNIQNEENEVDMYEDELGSYLLELSSKDLSAQDGIEVTKMLHLISDLERLSDHAVNISESAQEMHTKKLSFSEAAYSDLKVLVSAIDEITDMAVYCIKYNSIDTAYNVEPLEEIIDRLQAQVRLRHINRLKNNECTIELGFILTDILTNLERVADHCSNVAGCIIEISHNSLGMHSFTQSLKSDNKNYDKKVKEYSEKYIIEMQ